MAVSASLFARGLAVATALAMLPLASVATPAAAAPPSDKRPPVGELVERRSASSRTVRNADGTLTTSVFAAPVHYRDERGGWQPIDTSVVARRTDGYAFANGANRFRTLFKDTAAADFLRVDVADRSLRFSLIDSAPAPARHEGRQVTYAGIQRGVDVRYDATPDGVKETFVLADASVPRAYRMALRDDRGDLSATRRPDGSWVFRTPTGDGPLFVLEAPQAFDHADERGAAPTDVRNASLDVVRDGDRFVLTTTIDDTWLTAPERRFPVQLDPTLSIQPTTQDANFSAGCSNCLPSVQDKVYAGSGSTSTWRGAMQFDLSSVPSGAIVSDAKLGLFFSGSCITANATWCNGTDHTVHLHRMTAAWNMESVTSELAFDPTVLAATTVPYDTNQQWFAWPMTTTVQNWLAGTQPNHGLIIKRDVEAPGTSGPAFPGRRYTTEPSIQPKIDITYTSDAVDLFEPAVVHSNGAELRWSRYVGPTGAPFDRYEIHRSSTPNFTPSTATWLATVRDIAVTEFRDTTAAPSTAFTYKVVANTSPSNPRTVTLPADGQATIELQPGPADGKETYLYYSSNLVNCANYGVGERLWVGSDATRRYRPTLAFDVRDIPSGAAITSANLSLWQELQTVQDITTRAYRVSRDWREGTGYVTCTGDGATWYDADGGVKWTSLGGDFDAAGSPPVSNPTGSRIGWDTYDVRSLVEAWTTGQAPNLGFLLKSDDESHIEGRDFPYLSDDYEAAPSLRPKLVVTFTDGSHAQGPTVAVTSPGPGATVAGTAVALQASAGDDRRVERVEFLVGTTVVGTDTSEPFAATWNSTIVANGSHAVTARATDDAGNVTTSAPVSVTVENSPPPTVSLTAPSSGATVSGTVSVTANATDDRVVTRVEAFVDDERVGEDSTAPYAISWNTLDPNQPAYDGTRTLTAKAYDDSGQVTTSAARTVTVANTSGTKYRAGLVPTAVPAVVPFDPAAGAVQDAQGVDVSITNNGSSTLLASDVKLHYRWYAPGADPVTGAGVTTSAAISLPADIRSNRTGTVRALVQPPVLAEGIDRAQYRLQFDLKDAAGNWFAAKGNPPSDNWVIVNKKLSTALGLERHYHYDGGEIGGGVEHLVNVANGNSLLHWTPMASPGRGLSTVVDLTYNSLEQRSESPAGNNFSLSISGLSRLGNPLDVHPNNADSVAGRSNKWIAFTDPDGTVLRFEGVTAGDGSTYWKEPAGVNLYLRQFSTTDLTRKWALTRPDGVTFFYDSEGFPTSVEDANGNRLTFTLETTPPGDDPGGPKKRVTRVTDAAGQGSAPAPNRSFTIDYWTKAEVHKAHQRGKVQRLTDHNGSALDFDYYEDGNLLRITQRGGTSPDGITVADRSWVFTYTTSSGDGPAISSAAARANPEPRTPNQSSRLFSVRDPRGKETTFTYYGPTSGQLRWRLASRTDRDGQTTSYSYDLVNRVATATAPLSRVTSYAYGADGSVTSITDPVGGVTAVTWNQDRRPSRVTEPTGKYQEFAYNDNGYITDVWDELRNRTNLEYENRPVDANDVAGKWADNHTIPHRSRLLRKTSPRGTATATPTDDFQWSFTYDTKDNLLTATDPEGGVATHTYNADGTLATTKDANQRTTTYNTYDANGQVTKSTDAAGNVTQLAYNDDGLLTSVQDARHAGDSGPVPEEYRSRFYYDPFHRLARASTPKSTRQDRGNLIWTASEHDANDNVVATVGAHYGTRYTGAGARSTVAFDDMDRPTLHTGPDTSVDPAGERVQLAYDAAGRLIRRTSPKGVPTATADDFSESLAYDALDRVLRRTRFEGTGAALTGRTTHHCYNTGGDLVRITAPKAGAATVDCTAATPPDHTTRFEYDDAHRLVTTIDAEGRRTSRAYDADDNVVSTTDAANAVSTATYDERGLLTTVVEPFTGSPARSLTTRIEYDAVGNRTRVVSPRAWDASGDKVTFTDFVTTYDYDAVNRPVRIRLPKAGAEPQLYAHKAYDAVGNLVATTLPDPAATEAAVPASKRTTVEHFDTGWPRTTDDPAEPRVHYDYTAEGRQASRTPEDATGNLATSQTMTWTYFVDGTLKERKDRGGQASTYLYDAHNNLVDAVDAAGLVDNAQSPVEVVAEYDSLDRPSRVHQHRKADPATNWRFTAYTYDANGNQGTREDEGRETRDATTKVFTTTAPGQKHDFSYDRADWLTQAWDHGKTALHDTDDLRTTTSFWPTGREKQRTIEAGTATAGWTTRQTTTWDHFLNGKLRELVTKNGAGTVVEQHTVGYEDNGVYVNGHRTTDTFLVKGPDANAACYSTMCTARYTYDARDRLVREDNGRGAVTNFTLDSAGNIATEAITKGGSTQTRTSTYTGDRLQAFSTGGSTFKYLYDLDGNVDCITTNAWAGAGCPSAGTGSTVPAELVADYAYDYLNRLRSFRQYTAGTVQDSADYVYDALDRVAQQSETHGTTPARTTTFGYLGLTGELAEEQLVQSGSPTTTKAYSYDALGHRTAMAQATGTTTTLRTYGYDVHGNVSLLLGKAGDPQAAEAAYAYRPYGEKDADGTKGDTDDKNPLNPFRYSGKRLDSGTGTIDMGARRFGPDVSRFIQQDRFNGALADLDLATDPLTQNRYALAGGNPVGFVEWDGHRVMPDGGGGGSSTPSQTCPIVVIACTGGGSGGSVGGGSWGGDEVARSQGRYAGYEMNRQAMLRRLYQEGVEAIGTESKAMLAAGKGEEEVAEWAVNARNELRQTIRTKGGRFVAYLLDRGAAKDNPSYAQQFAKYKSNAMVIEKASTTNPGANRASGKLRIAGRIFIGIDVGLGVYNVASAPEVERPKVLVQEASRIGGSVAGGMAGMKMGGAAGFALGGPVGGAIGALGGGLAGALGGSWAASKAADWAIEEYYPTNQTGFEAYP